MSTQTHDDRRRTTDGPAGRAAWPLTLALVGIAPYLCLKAAWLLGLPWGVRDDAIVSSTAFRVANAATFAMDLTLPALVGVLLGRWRAIPLPLVRVMSWAGTGLLAGAAVAAVPGLVVVAATGWWPASSVGLDPWVFVVVYAGFAAQAVALAGAWSRSRLGGSRIASPADARAWARVLPVVSAALVALALLVLAAMGDASASQEPTERWDLAVDALILLVAAWATIRVRGRPPGARVPARLWTLTFVTTSAATAWGAYEAALAWAGLAGGWPLAVVHTARVASAAALLWSARRSLEPVPVGEQPGALA